MAATAVMAASCSSTVYLTTYNKMPLNASVGIDNVSISAYLSKFNYSNATSQCVLVGLPSQSITFYATSINASSAYYNSLLTIGISTTNSTGWAEINYNSSKLGLGTYSAVSDWAGNSTKGTVQSNNVSISLKRPVAKINTTCYGQGCGNRTLGQTFNAVASLCIGRPPFSWNTCHYLSDQQLSFLGGGFYLGAATTNSSGIASVNYNTTLLGVGTYGIYATWKGGTKYANANATTSPVTFTLNIYPAPTTTSVASNTSKSTTSTTSPTNQSSGAGSQTPASVAEQLVALYIVIAILLLALVVIGYKHYAHISRFHSHPRRPPGGFRPNLPLK